MQGGGRNRGPLAGDGLATAVEAVVDAIRDKNTKVFDIVANGWRRANFI